MDAPALVRRHPFDCKTGMHQKIHWLLLLLHCAALETDRGNGTVNVTNGTMTTAGQGSPGIYSTGDIKVSDAKITATGAEGAVIEGKNSISLTNTTLSGAKLWGVMLYQSFSGDAEIGTSSFKMNDGSLTDTDTSLTNIHDNGFTIYYDANLANK